MKTAKKKNNRQSGMTLIELMIAMAVLATGMCAIALLIYTAIASNNRNKTDTGATMVAQTVLNKFSTYPANLNANLNLTDCKPNGNQNLVITTAGAAGPNGAGATLIAPGQPNAGNINWLVPAVANYNFIYYSCGQSNAKASTAQPYEVRWNVMTMTVIGGTTFTKMVTVSARPWNPTGGAAQMKFYQPPVTLRTIITTS